MGNFAERLKEIRLQKNLTQEAFAAIAGVTKKSQLNYEKGERSPDADYLMRLAEEGLDVKYLLTGKHDRSKLNYIQGQLLDFYDKADDDSRAAVFDLFMVEQSGESAQQTLTYKQNVMEYLTGHRQYGDTSQEETELLHLWRQTEPVIKKVILNILNTGGYGAAEIKTENIANVKKSIVFGGVNITGTKHETEG
jgi:hypothetical protein|nr:MAG TPA: helix-turn-helix domain protein [Caudoviricetes sp.]